MRFPNCWETNESHSRKTKERPIKISGATEPKQRLLTGTTENQTQQAENFGLLNFKGTNFHDMNFLFE